MPATELLPRAVFWGHVVVALVILAVALALYRLVPELDLAPGGVSVSGFTRQALERGLPAGGAMLALSTVGYGLNRLNDAMPASLPKEQLNGVEKLALAVPGKAVGDVAGLAAVVVINAALAAFLLDLAYRTVRPS